MPKADDYRGLKNYLGFLGFLQKGVYKGYHKGSIIRVP